jgi:hypothetical protein
MEARMHMTWASTSIRHTITPAKYTENTPYRMLKMCRSIET